MNMFQDLLLKKDCSSASQFFDRLHTHFCNKPKKILDTNNLELIDEELIEEIKSLSLDLSICFGKSLRDLKCSIMDEENLRTHDIFLKYKSHRKIMVSNVNLPYSQLQDREYSSVDEVVTVFIHYIKSLGAYFNELESIDRLFKVMEPVRPTFKDDYRRISLDERVWLHIEITSNGLAANVHLVGQSEEWHDKLQDRLLSWDHDKEIVENIMTIFDLMKKSHPLKVIEMNTDAIDKKEVEAPSCGICFCVELPDNPGVPQPLCQNTKCGVYFHKSCLFQWLVACEGGRIPAFGVANGSCPTCLQPITCSEKDS
ncbi:unnamed protein product, partial [Brenthis ino]